MKQLHFQLLNPFIQITLQNVECVKQFRSMLMEKCQACSQQQKERLSQILTDADQQVGYLISERYINIPPQISVPMYESLL